MQEVWHPPGLAWRHCNTLIAATTTLRVSVPQKRVMAFLEPAINLLVSHRESECEVMIQDCLQPMINSDIKRLQYQSSACLAPHAGTLPKEWADIGFLHTLELCNNSLTGESQKPR